MLKRHTELLLRKEATLISAKFVKPLGCVLLLAAAVSPASVLSLSVLPAQPVEGSPFTLMISLVGSCPVPDSVVITPGHPGTVTVSLRDDCLSPPIHKLVEVPIGPLTSGPWNLRIASGGPVLSVNVARLPYRLDFNPPHPQARRPFEVRLSGSGSCPSLGPVQQDGNLLTLAFDDNCPILPPSPAPFEVERSVGLLTAGDYFVQVVDSAGHPLVSRRLHVFGSNECIPSETALCLSQGRFRVEATWRTGEAEGVARAHPETDDSGALWFFNAGNLELLVKVLDACQTRAPAFWVFAAGLTDVEVELVVTNMATQQTKRYRNPLGRPFAPILDTAAFPCPTTGVGSEGDSL